VISIIVPAYNQHELTGECLAAVHAHTRDYEIILVDNGSDPPIVAGNKTIRNESNLGFPVAVNQGIRAAKGDVIVLLNNDVIVTPGWAEGLTEDLADFAIVGPVTNYAAGCQRVTLPVYADTAELDHEAEAWARAKVREIQPVRFVIGFCMAFRRSLFDDLGPFDESLWPCSGEEIDFCLRARAAGHRIGVARAVYVHHVGSQTFNDMAKAGLVDYAAVAKRNDAHLTARWGADFWSLQQTVDSPAGIRLNLGCGRFHLPGFVNVDQFEQLEPDLVADVLALPYQPGTVDEIYAGHLLEHLTYDQGQQALAYWRSLLRPGGVIRVTVPDFDVIAAKHLRAPTADSMRELCDLYLYSYVQESLHRYTYNAALLVEALARAGFVGLERLPVDYPYFVDPVDWQVGYMGVRP
jgi:predicted SAM-dependent methyltransferase